MAIAGLSVVIDRQQEPCLHLPLFVAKQQRLGVAVCFSLSVNVR